MIVSLEATYLIKFIRGGHGHDKVSNKKNSYDIVCEDYITSEDTK